MSAPPTGTLTFLFTDIAGSSARFEQRGPAMHAALARHDALLRDAIARHGGYVFKTWGDAFLAAFPTASEAAAAALEAQLAIQDCAEAEAVGKLNVRFALHTGAAEFRDGDYYGDTLNRTDRLLKVAYGGQILLTGSAADLASAALPEGARLADLGIHRLRDLQRAERVFELQHPSLPHDFPPLRSLDYLPTNLPQQLTSFIGREREMREVKRHLAETRLLTLTGSGGCGKTRLALQVAADVLDEYPDGVWLVELAALRDPELVGRTVCAVLHLPEEPGRDAVATLQQHLRSRKLLLILDNCEHLVDATAALADCLLRDSPTLHILATSREGLSVGGEVVWRVPSLGVPPARRSAGAAVPPAALKTESVRLFLERARHVATGFTQTPAGSAAVVEICRQLDGIPLAIELAAALVNVLAPEQIAERLVDAFRLLTRGRRTDLPRHQTLRATIQWSYDLLTPQQQTLLRRLSVFAGGWVLGAAEDVCSGDGIEHEEVLELLTALVDKSLVIVDEEPDAPPRYRLLETVRQFANEALAKAGEEETLRDRHRDYFLAAAEEAEPQLQGPQQKEWLDRLEREHDNLRWAIAWSIDPDVNLRMAAALWRYWYVRGHFAEGRAALAGALARDRGASDVIRSRALNGHGVLACVQGMYDVARMQHEEALALRRKLGDPSAIAGSLNNLGLVARSVADYQTARRCYEESLGIYRSQQSDAGTAMVLSNLGVTAIEQDELDVAHTAFKESVEIYRSIGDAWCLSTALHNLGEVERKKEDLTSASASLREALKLGWELGDRGGLPLSLGTIAMVLVAQKHYETGAILFGASSQALDAISGVLPDTVRVEISAAESEARDRLGTKRSETLWKKGRTMAVSDAVSLALKPG